MNSENCPSQMILILLLSTDTIALKEVKNSTGWFVGFLCVPFLSIAIDVGKQEKKLVSSLCSATNVSVYGQYILQQTVATED